MHINPIYIYYLLATVIFGSISLTCMSISIWKYDNITSSPYNNLMYAFGSLCWVIGSECITGLWGASRYAQYMPRNRLGKFFITVIVAAVIYQLLFSILKWSIVKYKKYLKDKQIDISDDVNRSNRRTNS